MAKTIHLTPADNLQEQFDRAAPGTVFHLAPGLYHQKVMIKTPGITLIGNEEEESAIDWDDYANKRDENGVEYNTFRTWTVAVCADNVTMRNLTIQNTAHYPEVKGQEVALSVLGDHFLMENCLLYSTQDTLFCGPLPPDLIERYQGFHRQELLSPAPSRQVYRNCLIQGSVDFIFGCGDAVFENCEIRSMFDVRMVGYVAAPAHSKEQNHGFLFRNCRFTAENGVPSRSIYLARPWRDYGLCRFVNCTYDRHIALAGFDPWNDSGRDHTARFHEFPTVPGRVPWAKDVETEFR